MYILRTALFIFKYFNPIMTQSKIARVLWGFGALGITILHVDDADVTTAGGAVDDDAFAAGRFNVGAKFEFKFFLFKVHKDAEVESNRVSLPFKIFLAS
jgi:hypothetical protein